MSWINNAVMYNIYPLGFSGAPMFNDFNKTDRLDKIYDFIPHFIEMGVNTIVFNPVFESSRHGYDTIDYYKIDSRLGDNESFKRICNALHDNGINVILDGVFNHVGRDFFAFKDIQEKGCGSQYCSWFCNLDFNRQSPMGDNFYYEGWSGHYDLVKLNLSNEDVVNHLLGAVRMWINEFKINGLRLDAADVMDFNFFKRLKSAVAELDSEFWIYGEIVNGDYNRWANKEMLDSVTNYEIYKPLFSSLNEHNYFELAHSLDREYGDWGMYKNLYLYNFVDNHDQSRIASKLYDKGQLKNIYTALFTIPGVPSIYYGSEYGIEGVVGNGSDMDVRKELNLDNIENRDDSLYDHICKLSKIMHSLESLQYGKYQNEQIQNETLCYSRRTDNQCVYVLLNMADNTRNISFGTGFDGYLTDVLNDNNRYDCHDWVGIDVPAKSSMILIANDGSFEVDLLDKPGEAHVCPPITPDDEPADQDDQGDLPTLEEEEITLGRYWHYKGKEYEVTGFATNSETGEYMVIYKTVDEDEEKFFVRPYDNFRQIIDVDGEKVRRFQKIS